MSWTGWITHRQEASFFEIATEKFVLRRKKTSRFIEEKNISGLFFAVGISITEKKPVSYSETRGSEIQLASLVPHETLCNKSDKRWGGPVNIQMTGEEILRRAKMLLNGRVERRRLGLMLAEVVGWSSQTSAL